MFEIENKIEWIGDLFQSVEPIYIWCFDLDGRVVATNNPEIELIDQLFVIHSWRQYMLRHFQLKDSPYIMGSPFGIVWMCAVDKRYADRIRSASMY